MSPYTRLKLYGERNTGTRYLAKLLGHNLHCDLLRGVVPRWVTWLQGLTPGKDAVRDGYFERSFERNFGWKHSQVRPDRLATLGRAVDGVHFVTLVKNPYSWLLSLDRRPYHRSQSDSSGPQDLRALVTREWATVGRENGPSSYRDAMDIWNCKVRSYLELADRWPTTVMTYEDLVEDPETQIDSIRQSLRDEWRHGQFENLAKSTKEKGKDSAYYRDYYGNERWRSELPDEVIRLANERLDGDLMEQLGYRRLEPFNPQGAP